MYVARYIPNSALETTCGPNENRLVLMSIDPAASTIKCVVLTELSTTLLIRDRL